MNVALAPDLANLVRAKMERDGYDSATAVIDDALRLLGERDRRRALRRSLEVADDQIDRGEGVEWSAALLDQLTQEAEEMARQGMRPHADVLP